MILRNVSLFLLLATTLVPRAALATDVYIVIGQSNGFRLSSLADGPNPDPDPPGEILYFPMGCSTRPESTKLQIIHSAHASCHELGRRMAHALATATRN